MMLRASEPRRRRWPAVFAAVALGLLGTAAGMFARHQTRISTVALAAEPAVVKGSFSYAGTLPDPYRDAALETDGAGALILTEAEAWAALESASYWAHCDNVTYAYCGRATCRVDGERATATCGCKRIVGAPGSLGVNSKDAYLIRSPVVRKALYELTVKDARNQFVTTLCEAIEDKTLWRSAGFDADFGSFSDPTYPGEWAVLDVDCDASASRAFNLADCDGAPCDIDQGSRDAVASTVKRVAYESLWQNAPAPRVVAGAVARAGCAPSWRASRWPWR